MPRPASPRAVFRPARRVSWATRIFAFLVFLLAAAAVAYFLAIVLPARVADLARLESKELTTARQSAATVNASIGTLWTDIGARGSMSLEDSQVAKDLTLAQTTETAAEDALGHVQSAEAYLTEADAVPFQFHHPAFVASDRPALVHLERSLQAAIKVAHGANLQLALAQHTLTDRHNIGAQLNPSLSARNWRQVADLASNLQTDLNVQREASLNPEAFVDPLWTKWIEAMIAYAAAAQQFSLDSARGQTQAALQDARTLAAASDQMAAAFSQAQTDAPSWQQKTVQPLLDPVAAELAAAG